MQQLTLTHSLTGGSRRSYPSERRSRSILSGSTFSRHNPNSLQFQIGRVTQDCRSRTTNTKVADSQRTICILTEFPSSWTLEQILIQLGIGSRSNQWQQIRRILVPSKFQRRRPETISRKYLAQIPCNHARYFANFEDYHDFTRTKDHTSAHQFLCLSNSRHRFLTNRLSNDPMKRTYDAQNR